MSATPAAQFIHHRENVLCGGSMKAYLVTTGTLFAFLALAHLLRTAAEWRRLVADPWFVLEGPVLGIVAGALCFWAWRLLRVQARP
jgi:hypothetical protein